MQTLIECVPNFSEGRDAGKVGAIVQAMLAGPGVYLLDQEMDADHNRSVITLVGSRESIGEAALRGIGKAAELIDLNKHRGAHPRLGATDVVPFVPVSGVTLEDCVSIAERVAEQAWNLYGVPTYLYEAAARTPERRNLENIRRGQFEGVREEVKTNPERRPDFGPDRAALHPTAGATVVGARKFLIAYNVNLATPDVSVAKTIAKTIRASSGGMPCVKAMGVELKARGRAQVSMNLTDFQTTPIGVVFDAVTRQATAAGVEIEGSEIVGLIPRQALDEAAVHYLRVENFQPGLILENRLESVMTRAGSERAAASASQHPPPPPAAQTETRTLAAMATSFVEAVGAPTPTPGGGSVAALATALGAALGEMVCRLSLKKKNLADHYPKLSHAAERLAGLRQRSMEAIDDDAESYEAVLAAMRLPKADETEKAARQEAIETASKKAALVPLHNAELAAEVEATLEAVRPISLAQAASDVRVALSMAAAGRAGAIENVRANLPSISDREWVAEIERKLTTI